MNKPAVMIVAESQVLCAHLKDHIPCQKLRVVEAPDQVTALRLKGSQGFGLVIIDSPNKTAWDGLVLAEQIRATDRSIPLILISRQSSEAQAIAALKLGVNDYFKWPIDYDELLNSIERHIKVPQGGSEHVTALSEKCCPSHLLLGNSRAMRRIREDLPTVAKTDCTVLITGETGTGKECVARQIHQCSPRRDKPLVCINCAALPDSLLESELFGFERGAFTGANTAYPGKLKLAAGGSVFFDEIGDMSPYAQAKVLRVFENKEITPLRAQKSETIDVRMIAATNQDLKQLVLEHRFREDLYYRINVSTICLPPLRERKEDIPLLLSHYLHLLNNCFHKEIRGITDEALQCLLRYHWPGNVRELKNLLEALVAAQPSSEITLQALPHSIRRSFIPDAGSMGEEERLLSALLATNWNKSKAAEKLHWSRMTVYRKIAKYHIAPPVRWTKPLSRRKKNRICV